MHVSSSVRTLGALFTGCLTLLLLLPDFAAAQGCSTVRASVATNGGQSTTYNGQPDLSADGRYVVFTTSSPNLVPTGGGAQVARHDLVTGETTLVSAGPGGVPANGGVNETPRISPDGRWVVWSTSASNLGPSDTNNERDIYLHDMTTGANTLVSRSTAGVLSNGNSFHAAVSTDGLYVAFSSSGSNLVPADTNGESDVFVFDRLAGTIVLVSLTAAGVTGDLYSTHPSISADGRYVAFAGAATTFHPADVNGVADVFVKDRVTGALTLVSARPEGIPGNGSSDYPSISGDGRFVAFHSLATDFGPPDHPIYSSTNVFVRDLAMSTTTLVDLTVLGGPTTSQSEYPDISSDGRFVAFQSSNVDLVIGDTNGATDIFLHDRLRNQTLRASLNNADVQSNGFCATPAVSDDGEHVAFISSGTGLVEGDTNGTVDAFVRTCPTLNGTAFCAGDGTGTPCPCANSGALGSGCASASQAYGGHLFALGAASVTADTFVLRGEGLPVTFITYFQGTAQVNGGMGSVFGDGLLCATGSVIRLGTKFSPGGVSGYPAAGDQAISVKGQIPVSGGVTRTYQGWYRAAAEFCTSDMFNMTNGIEVFWQP